VIATTLGAGQVAYDILWFFLMFIEIWLSISIFIDIFRSHDLKGWQKALWIIFVLLIPILGILIYLIVRGDKMRAHQIQASQEWDEENRGYAHRGAGGERSVASELSELADLRDRGVLTNAEFEELKGRVIDQTSKTGTT
jgi:hypothetical protein